MKKALITGITGQDGSYLAEFLLSSGYEVHGIIRRASTFNTSRIDHIYVDLDRRYFRPTEVQELIADSTKAKKNLDWHPKIRFKELVRIMVDADIRKSGLKPIGEGVYKGGRETEPAALCRKIAEVSWKTASARLLFARRCSSNQCRFSG